MGNSCGAAGNASGEADQQQQQPRHVASANEHPPTRSASIDTAPECRDRRDPTPVAVDGGCGKKPPLSGRTSPHTAAPVASAVIPDRVVVKASRRRDVACKGAVGADEAGGAASAAADDPAEEDDGGTARPSDRPFAAAAGRSGDNSGRSSSRSQEEQQRGSGGAAMATGRHRDPVQHHDDDAASSGRDDVDDSHRGGGGGRDRRLRSMEAELSSFRCEVASAVVETATLLSELRNELRSLRKENQHLVEWKAAQEAASAQRDQRDERIHRAVTEMVEAQLKTQTEVAAIRRDLADHKRDAKVAGELVHTVAANTDAALQDVQETRIQLATTEQAMARQGTMVSQLEAAVRSCTREQSALTSELRAMRADTTVMQRRFERHRDEQLFGGR